MSVKVGVSDAPALSGAAVRHGYIIHERRLVKKLYMGCSAYLQLRFAMHACMQLGLAQFRRGSPWSFCLRWPEREVSTAQHRAWCASFLTWYGRRERHL